jgi:hypothetical protein
MPNSARLIHFDIGGIRYDTWVVKAREPTQTEKEWLVKLQAERSRKSPASLQTRGLV